MKVLVIGATGFIGSHVARALINAKHDVRILRRSKSPTLALEGLDVESVVGDINDKESLKKALSGCEALCHTAAYYPLYSIFGREAQKQIAVRQIQNVFEAALETKIKKVVYTSSMSTIGKTKDGAPSDENTPYEDHYFTGLYYQIKRLLEAEAHAFIQKGLPIVMVNPTGVFGDYDVKPTSGALIVELMKGKVPVIVDAKMNTVDAADVGRGQVAALEKGRVGEKYILGSHNTTVWELTHLIAKIGKVSPPRLKIPLAVAHAGAYLSELTAKLFHQEKPFMPLVGIDFLKYGMHYDTSKAKKELGFTSIPLEETLDRAISWFQKHHYA